MPPEPDQYPYTYERCQGDWQGPSDDECVDDLLGAEDHGLTNEARERVHRKVILPGRFCLNVAVAGSIVIHDRWQQFAKEPS